MQRLPDWRTRLGAHIAAHRTRPFAYGAHDCATFAAGAVQAVTGSDPAAGLTGYTTRAGGLRRLRRNGLEDHVAFVASRFAEIPVAGAGQGDLAVIDAAGALSLGVVYGGRCREQKELLGPSCSARSCIPTQRRVRRRSGSDWIADGHADEVVES